MATIGLSKPYYAVYSNTGTAVTYASGAVMGKATEANIEIETTDDNNLYANNAIAETDRSFAGGILTLSTDDLSQEVSKAILGLREQVLSSVEGVTDEDVSELIYDDQQNTPYLGVGFIIKKKVGGVYKWRGVVLTKVMFSVPSDAATTQGETIEWQVPELTATIMRDDTATHMWKREATFTTEAQAEAYIQNRLSITPAPAPTLGTLTVQSVAGAESGDTKLTVTPELTGGNHYVYQTGATVTLPTQYGADVSSGWTTWNGTDEIAATTGNEIGVVEANSSNQAVKAGKTTVTANAGG